MDEVRRKLFWLSLFTVAMAYLEASVVVYLRRIYYPDNPLELFPLRVWATSDLVIELGREVSTILMILGAAALAEKGRGRIFAAFLYIFGLWDIFYYVWLKVLIGWPRTWLEWDILFLIPWAWLGPWLMPALVAFLFVLWGGIVLRGNTTPRFTGVDRAVFVVGVALVLVSFLQPAMHLLPLGMEALADFRPGEFWWGAYGTGYTLVAVALWKSAQPIRNKI